MTAPAPLDDTQERRAKSHRRIVIILATCALLFAGGGGALLVKSILGRPGDPAELPISADVPLAVGDRLVLHVDEKSCEVELLSILDDGRVLLVPCASDGVPTPVSRSSLRAPLYRRDRQRPRAVAGDVVVDPSGAEHARLVVVDTSKPTTVCVRPEDRPTAACTDVRRVGLLRLRPSR